MRVQWTRSFALKLLPCLALIMPYTIFFFAILSFIEVNQCLLRELTLLCQSPNNDFLFWVIFHRLPLGRIQEQVTQRRGGNRRASIRPKAIICTKT